MIKDLTTEEVQELLELTPSQEKIFRAFERAVKKCDKAGIRFHQVLSSVYGLNGNNIKTIDSIENTIFDCNGPRDLNQSLHFDSVEVSDAWADDTHVVILKGETGYLRNGSHRY